MMRRLVLPTIAWVGALQAVVPMPANVEIVSRLIGIASLLGSLSVLVYRLGVWRQDMENTKHKLHDQMKVHREESAAAFERIERRLDAIDHGFTMLLEQGSRRDRWQHRADKRLRRLEPREAHVRR